MKKVATRMHDFNIFLRALSIPGTLTLSPRSKIVSESGSVIMPSVQVVLLPLRDGLSVLRFCLGIEETNIGLEHTK